jgi:hypothetical protein
MRDYQRKEGIVMDKNSKLTSEAEFRLALIQPNRLSLADLSISAESEQPATHCHRVTFTVTLSPGLSRTSDIQAVKVRVTDKVFGVPMTVGEVLLFVPAGGGSTSATIEWPMPADAKFTSDFVNEITVVVDPDNAIAERNEKNNSVTVFGRCLG